MSLPSETDPLFPSLMALRAAHADLLKRHRHAGETPELLAAVMAFLQRGQATGVLLAEEEDRWTAQSLLDYWSTSLYRAGSPVPSATLVDFDPAQAPALPDSACPYLGLDAFREENADIFFGRRRVVGELIERLRERRLVAIVGPSGSGKSSLVRAGLIPALRADALPGAAVWAILSPLIPGSAPRDALERMLAGVVRTDGTPLLLVIDQFEEAFTLCTDAAQRTAFLNQVVALVGDPAVPHRVVLTMRSDFEPFVSRAEQLLPLFEDGKVGLPPLSAGELREAIERPAERVGLKFEAGVVDALLQDILGEPAALPLLQFTLLKLWEQRERNRVTLASYRRIGGGRLALARSADALYGSLIPEEQVTAQRIILRMVRPAEGLEVTSNRIRRRDLDRGGEDPGRVARVLDKLVAARLVRVTTGDSADDTQVEVAHEALVRNWPTLVEWLEDERVSLRQRQRFAAIAQQWDQLGRAESALLRGILLDEARQYDDLDAMEQDFVADSEEAVARSIREREAAQQRELEQAKALATAQARSVRVLAVFLLVAIVGGAYAVYLSFVAARAEDEAQSQRATAVEAGEVADQQRATAQTERDSAATAEAEAQRQRDLATTAETEAQQQRATAETNVQVAEVRRLAISARTLLTIDPEVSRLLTIEAAQTMVDMGLPDPDDFVFTTLQEALRTPYTAAVLRGDTRLAVRQAIWSPDNRAVATISDDSVVRIWQLLTGEVRQLKGHTALLVSISWSPSGDRLLTASADGTARVWDVATGRLLKILTQSQPPDFMRDIAWSFDGRFLATANNNKTAAIWDSQTYRLIHVLRGHASNIGFVSKIIFSPDNRCLLSISDDATARIWDVATGEALDVLIGHAPSDSLTWGAWSPDGTRIVTAGTDRSARIWQRAPPPRNLPANACPWRRDSRIPPLVLSGLEGHESEVGMAIWSPDERFVATGAGRPKPAYTPDATIRIWDATNGALVQVLSGHTSRITSLAYSVDGSRLLSASNDGTARVWDVQTGQALLVLTGHMGSVNSAVWSNDESLILTAGDDRTARIWAQDSLPATADDLPAMIRLAQCQASRGLTDEEINRLNVPRPLKFNFAARQCPPRFTAGD